MFRKGGNEAYVYFGPEVEAALRQYLPVRANVVPVPGHEHALFYSTQRKRMNVRSVEIFVSGGDPHSAYHFPFQHALSYGYGRFVKRRIGSGKFIVMGNSHGITVKDVVFDIAYRPRIRAHYAVAVVTRKVDTGMNRIML